MASNGKVALVTGGGSGIGKASALALAREGFAVVVAGRRPEPLHAVVAEIEGLQGKALGVPSDVGDPASVEALVRRRPRPSSAGSTCCSTMPGSAPPATSKTSPATSGMGVIGSIVNGTFLCTQQAFRMMKEQNADGRAHHQ